jgi:hypothetical protein
MLQLYILRKETNPSTCNVSYLSSNYKYNLLWFASFDIRYKQAMSCPSSLVPFLQVDVSGSPVLVVEVGAELHAST